MRLDSVSSLAEIAKYYGTLGETYKLMRCLSRKTSKIWEGAKVELQRTIKRKTIRVNEKNDKHFRFLTKYTILTSLFHYDNLIWMDENRYRLLLELIDQVEDPKLFKSELSLQLNATRNLNISISNLYDYRKNSGLTYIKMYIQIINKMKEIGIELSNVLSYVFAEDLPNIHEWEFIHTVILVLDNKMSTEDIITHWKNFRINSSCEINNVKIILIDWQEKNLSRTIEAIDHNYIEIILASNNHFRIIDYFYENDIPLFKKLSVKCLLGGDYFLNDFKGDSWYSFRKMKICNIYKDGSLNKIIDGLEIMNSLCPSNIQQKEFTEILNSNFKWKFEITQTVEDNKTK